LVDPFPVLFHVDINIYTSILSTKLCENFPAEYAFVLLFWTSLFFIPIIIGASAACREIIEKRNGMEEGRKGRKHHNKKTVQYYLCWDEPQSEEF
jgi:hypothetical protein